MVDRSCAFMSVHERAWPLVVIVLVPVRACSCLVDWSMAVRGCSLSSVFMCVRACSCAMYSLEWSIVRGRAWLLDGTVAHVRVCLLVSHGAHPTFSNWFAPGVPGPRRLAHPTSSALATSQARSRATAPPRGSTSSTTRPSTSSPPSPPRGPRPEGTQGEAGGPGSSTSWWLSTRTAPSCGTFSSTSPQVSPSPLTANLVCRQRGIHAIRGTVPLFTW